MLWTSQQTTTSQNPVHSFKSRNLFLPLDKSHVFMHERATPDFQFWNNIFLLHYCSILTKHNKYFFQSLWRLWARSAEAAAWEILHSPQVSVSQIQVVLSSIILDKTIRGGEAEEETASDTGNSQAELSWQLMNDTNAPPPSHLQTRTENECKTWLISQCRTLPGFITWYLVSLHFVVPIFIYFLITSCVQY